MVMSNDKPNLHGRLQVDRSHDVLVWFGCGFPFRAVRITEPIPRVRSFLRVALVVRVVELRRAQVSRKGACPSYPPHTQSLPSRA